MTWFLGHLDEILAYAVQHAWLSCIPLLVALALALPVGWFAARSPRVGPLVVATSGLLYTVPSLALFVIMPLVLGTQILDPINVVVAMTVYTFALLVRSVVDGLTSVPEHVRLSATAMGYRPLARLLQVELPVAVPVLAAGLRVAAVSNVSIVSVASVIGVPQLGTLLTDGYNRAFLAQIVTGLIGCVLLALLVDAVLVVATRALTPWTRVGGAA